MDNATPLQKPVAENNVGLRQTRSNKAPVYTSDKRAKFTQKANKKWVRLATVLGYIVSVSTPAVVLSIYYIFFWDPKYLENNPANATRDQGMGGMGSFGHQPPSGFKPPGFKVKRELDEAVPIPAPPSAPVCECNCPAQTIHHPAPQPRDTPPLHSTAPQHRTSK